MSNLDSAATAHDAALSPGGGMSSVPAGTPSAPPQCSDRIDAISAALAKAQGQIANPGKTAVNPHFKSSYADLSAGLNAIRTALSANAIAVVQTTRMEGDMLMLNTMLAHSSGQWIGSQWQVCKLPAPPQVIGSALTYARRYTLFALVGIAGEGEDDDANAATSHDPVIDVDDLVYVESLIRDTDSDVGKFLETVGATAIDKMKISQFKRGVGLLEAKKRRAGKAT